MKKKKVIFRVLKLTLLTYHSGKQLSGSVITDIIIIIIVTTSTNN